MIRRTLLAVMVVAHAAINEGLESADMKANLARFSAIAKTGSPEDFAAFLADEMPRWAEIVKLSGAKVD